MCIKKIKTDKVGMDSTTNNKYTYDTFTAKLELMKGNKVIFMDDGQEFQSLIDNKNAFPKIVYNQDVKFSDAIIAPSDCNKS